MRIVRITNESNVSALRAQSDEAAPGMLEKLNPHLDLSRITPGAVLVLPDAVDAKSGKSTTTSTVSAEVMQSFIGFTKDALEASAKRVQAAAERAKAEESALAVAIKSRTVNAALEKDPELKKMFDVAQSQGKADSEAAAEGVKAFAALGSAALQELEVLTKRLG